MKQLLFAILSLCMFLPAAAAVKDTVTVVNTMDDVYAVADTTLATQAPTTAWKPDPNRATWLAVIVPGLGQIYNQSYWKLPIVYGAFMGCAYAISWNGNMYNDYKTAYRDILTDTELSTDPTRSYNAILPPGYTIESMGGRSQYTATLNSRQNRYRRFRDISIAATVAVYVLTIIDAYVDAQLFDFEISPDLTLNVSPDIHLDSPRNSFSPVKQQSAEIKLALTF